MPNAARWIAIAIAAFTVSCGGPQGPVSPQGGSASLESRSDVRCRSEAECGVCYKPGSCGEPIAASSPQLADQSCHASPPAFCLPRRAYCDEGHCVAR